VSVSSRKARRLLGRPPRQGVRAAGRPLDRRGIETTVSTAASSRFGFDDLRRFAAALGIGCGLTPVQALAMASHLLWFDAAGAASLGVASLPEWLEAIENGQVDPRSMGRVVRERSASAVFDGENGLPPLLLERAAELAVEKARETAVGLVRVDHLRPVGSAAAVAAGIALGPMAGLIFGPNRLWSLALPCEAGLPVVIDSGLAGSEVAGKPQATRTPGKAPKPPSSRPEGLLPGFDRWEALWLGSEVFRPAESWVIAVVSATAWEPLSAFHERVAAAVQDLDETSGRLVPRFWDARRRAAHECGIAVPAPAWKSLNQWARRLAVEIPRPFAPRREPT
jgi:LDH2 family malate/lactate/ureidoglycolate dehydrogenase